MACNRNREIDDALRELAEKVGASVEFEQGHVHRRAYFALNGRFRFDVLTGTPSRTVIINVVSQAKRTLRSLGAAL